MVSPSLTSWTSCNGSHLNALFLLPIKILFPCVCVCVFFFWLLLLVLVHFCSECNRVWFRLFQSTSQGNSTSTQPQVESFENTIEPKTLFCFVFVLNLICFEPSHNNLLEQIPTGIQAIMQGLCFWHLSGQHIFWWQEGWILFPIQVWFVAVLFGNLEILFGCQFCRIQHKVNIFACFDANPAWV